MVAVTTVEPLDGYKLRLIFDDGSKRVVDLTADLWGPMGEPLRDPALFRQVRVDPELRTIVWPIGFDLDPDGLHGRSSQDLSPAAPEQPATLAAPFAREREVYDGKPAMAGCLRPDVRRFGEERGRAGFRQETPRRIEAGPRTGASASGRAYPWLSESRCLGATVASIDASAAARASQMARSASLAEGGPGTCLQARMGNRH
jgi:Protein of unknown function (DUF2442)